MDDLKEIMKELTLLKKRVAHVEKVQVKTTSGYRGLAVKIGRLIARITTNENNIRRNNSKR